MLISLHGGGMLPVFPEGAIAIFALIIFLPCPSSYHMDENFFPFNRQ